MNFLYRVKQRTATVGQVTRYSRFVAVFIAATESIRRRASFRKRNKYRRTDILFDFECEFVRWKSRNVTSVGRNGTLVLFGI